MPYPYNYGPAPGMQPGAPAGQIPYGPGAGPQLPAMPGYGPGMQLPAMPGPVTQPAINWSPIPPYQVQPVPYQGPQPAVEAPQTPAAPPMGNYVTRDELEAVRAQIRALEAMPAADYATRDELDAIRTQLQALAEARTAPPVQTAGKKPTTSRKETPDNG